MKKPVLIIAMTLILGCDRRPDIEDMKFLHISDVDEDRFNHSMQDGVTDHNPYLNEWVVIHGGVVKALEDDHIHVVNPKFRLVGVKCHFDEPRDRGHMTGEVTILGRGTPTENPLRPLNLKRCEILK